MYVYLFEKGNYAGRSVNMQTRVSVHGPKVDVHYAKTSDFRIINRYECQNIPLELSPNSVT